MTMTSLKTWVNLEVLTHTDMNLYVGAGGNLSHLFAELATAAGQIPYSTAAKAVAVLAAGTGLLHMNGAAAPTITTLVNADVAAAAAIAHAKLGAVARTQLKHSTSQTLTTGVMTALSLDSEQYDNATWHDDATNNTRITVPRAGVVVLAGCIVFDINATGYRHVRITKGGTTTVVANFIAVAFAGQYVAIPIAYVDPNAAAGEFYIVSAAQNSGGNLDIVHNQANYPTSVTAHLLET